LSPQARRQVVATICEQTAISERSACGLAGISRTTLLYEARPDRRSGLSEPIVELAQQRRRFGYRRIGVLLRREGHEVNDKAEYRRYRELGLMVGRRRRRQSLAAPRKLLTQPSQPNTVWSLDMEIRNRQRSLNCGLTDGWAQLKLGQVTETPLPPERVLEQHNELERAQIKSPAQWLGFYTSNSR
jgi:putative transposase